MNTNRDNDARVPAPDDRGDADLPPFPPEQGWLQQPLPPELAEFDQAAFTERTLAALHDERELDQKLQQLDADLPRIVLSSYEAPKPAPDFVPSVLAALHTDRQSRWQQLLARHVAPEPSPQFVARTLAALRQDQLGDGAASDLAGPAATPTAAPHPFAGPRSAGSQGTGFHGARPRSPLPRILPWLALAAGALLWLALRDATPPPFEARLAAHAPRLQAHGGALSPLPAALAKLARDDDPTAFDSASPDGVWLQLARGSRR
ncbi:MAG: hypothetical protein JNL12_21750 [Planctomycetes bacterium]|nr:hypothetical protein [Planctomycetota bacterium]